MLPSGGDEIGEKLYSKSEYRQNPYSWLLPPNTTLSEGLEAVLHRGRGASRLWRTIRGYVQGLLAEKRRKTTKGEKDKMKKTIAILLALLMVLSLAACGGGSTPTPTPAATEAPQKPQAVQDVEALIDAIGEVSIKSGETIDKAEKEYSYLREAEQAQVENYSSLARAKDDYNEAITSFLVGNRWQCIFTVTADDFFSRGDKGDKITLQLDFNNDGFVTEKILGGTHGPLDATIKWARNGDLIDISNTVYWGVDCLKIDFENETLITTDTSDVDGILKFTKE